MNPNYNGEIGVSSILKAGYGICRLGESQHLRMHEGTDLLLLRLVWVFVFERISALQSQGSSQRVEIWRRDGATWIIGDPDGNARLGRMRY